MPSDVDDKGDEGDVKDGNGTPQPKSAPGGTVVLFEGGRGSDERREQFDRLCALLDDLRARGLDDELYPNRLCPAHLKTTDAWGSWFLQPGIDREVHQSALKTSDGHRARTPTTDRAKAGKRNALFALAAVAGPSASTSSSASPVPPSGVTSSSLATVTASTSSTRPAASSSSSVSTPADLFRLSTLPRGTSLWTVTSAVAPTFKQLGTEASATAKGIEVVGCISCREIITVKVDNLQQSQGWRHACSGEPADLEEGDGREGCWSTRVYTASDLFKFPALRHAVGNVLEERPLADVLQSIRNGPLCAFAELLPPTFIPSDRDPPVLVIPNSSPEWWAFNAIALSHSLTAGAHQELEGTRQPSVRAMAGIVSAVPKARKEGRRYINIIECANAVCDEALARLILALTQRGDLTAMVMSATAAVQQFVDYFQRFNPAVVSLPGPKARLTRNVLKTPRYTRDANADGDVTSWGLRAAELAGQSTRKGKGDVLVFCPGKGAFFAIKRLMSSVLEQTDPPTRSDISLLFRDQGDESMRESMEDRSDAQGKRVPKIMISTNIAETSLTFPHLKNVIASGLMKMNLYDPTTEAGCLLTVPAPRDTVSELLLSF